MSALAPVLSKYRDKNLYVQHTLRSQELIVARMAQNHFLTIDQRARLGVSPEEFQKMQAQAGKLLGGGWHTVAESTVVLRKTETFSTETDREMGHKVYVDTSDTLHVTVLYKRRWDNNVQVIYDGPFSGKKDFAEGKHIGHFQLTIRNDHDSKGIFGVLVQDHVEPRNRYCPIM